MIAILICTGQNPELHGLDEHLPTPLLPVGDRPFLQHIIEYLILQGVRQFEVLLSHLPEKIESYFGSGIRWGCHINYHLCPNPGQPYKLVRNVARALTGTLILGSSDCLPVVDYQQLPAGESLALFDRDRWTRWGRFEAGTFPELPAGSGSRVYQVESCIGVASAAELLAAQKVLLDGSVPELMINGNSSQKGVWIARNVSIHPTAALHAPLYIGANCEIGPGAQIGPYAVIGDNCVVDQKSTVVDSLVTSGTYIGEGLELDRVIVDRNRLVNARLGTSCLVSEEFLVGSLTMQGPRAMVLRAAARIAAALLFAVLSPLFLVTRAWLALTRRGCLATREFVQLPASESPRTWKAAHLSYFRREPEGHTANSPWVKFLLEFIPGLLSVTAGRLRMVGVAPRTAEEILALPSDWRSLYRSSKAGLISEADIMFGDSATDEEIYSAEAFYSAKPTLKHDLRLFWQYVWRLFAAAPKTLEPESAVDVRN
jgi:NDP-sugar pyrophosphorylase family protein